MDYTQQGVLRVQARIAERINRALVADPRLRLDHIGWFDGRMDLPRPGEAWKTTLSRGGESLPNSRRLSSTPSLTATLAHGARRRAAQAVEVSATRHRAS